MSTLFLRSEVKSFEKRTALSPENAKELLRLGHRVIVEKSENRIFSDYEYQQVGCEIAEPGVWKSASKDSYVLGLKELSCDSQQSIEHKHIYFAHAYKSQSHSKELLSKFSKGGGVLYDLEYLLDCKGQRVAAFGLYAGIAGAALGITAWYSKSSQPRSSFEDKIYFHQEEMLNELNSIIKKYNVLPKV
ncbi:MAG: saccharopine dehydrogenase, partial [Bdellovibrionota bacterium]